VLLNSSAGILEAESAENLRERMASAFEQHRISAVLEFLPGSDLHTAST
jgi:hypothetical protein